MAYPAHTPMPIKSPENALALVPYPDARRQLATINVSPGAGTLQAAHDAASAGDVLVLADGTYTGTGINVLEITKSITIRAANSRQAIIHGQDDRRGIKADTGGTTIVLEVPTRLHGGEES